MTEHLVRSYDDELTRLNGILIEMGRQTQLQMDDAILALTHQDNDLAGRVVEGDHRLDQMEQQVQSLAMHILALRQPEAEDLRLIVSSLKISAGMERVGDLIANLAKRTLMLHHIPPVKTRQAVLNMAHVVQDVLKDVMDAYANQDVSKAMDVWRRDQEVDALYADLFRELISYMMEDTRTITSCTHLMFMAKNIERIGDHATNIAEALYFLVEGHAIREERPKTPSVV